MSRCTITDVAREAGVSVSTVSRVLNGKPEVAPATVAAVEQTIKRLGYVANRSARCLAGARARAIGLLIPTFTDYAIEIMRGVSEILSDSLHDMILYSFDHLRGEGQTRSYTTMLSRSPVDGLIVVLPAYMDGNFLAAYQRERPIVLIDDKSVNVDYPTVGAANVDGALQATRYLLALGHHRIGFITGDRRLSASGERIDGYCQALRDAHVAIDPALIVEGDYIQRGGYQAAMELLALPEPPTAIFASNDEEALGAMDAVQELGLRIPEDISVVGFDDVPAAARARPPLTTVHQPLTRMGRAAVEMLLDLLDGRPLSNKLVLLPTPLVVRESCCPPASRSAAWAREAGIETR
jgi:LacI family transcriptional regulator